MPKPQILKCNAREILDSRGNPTVEASVMLTDGTVGVASVPSGASTGIYEAREKRDGDPKRYNGKGVLDAVCDICKIISPALSGVYASEQSEIDKMLEELPPLTIYEAEYAPEDAILSDGDDHAVTITRDDKGTYVVEGEWLYNLVGQVNFEDRESLMFFQRVLLKSGVIDKLKEAGCRDGDSVSMYDFEFDFVI